MEVNQINNKELKINIGNYAITLLLNQKLIQKEDLKNTKMTFGYIFTKEDGVLEALLKIICNKKTYYFAAQKGKLMLINIGELEYNQTIDYMINYHECLRNVDSNETETQKNRRIKNNQYLNKNNITSNDNLLCYFDDETVVIKNIDEICKRAIACLITVQIACDINNGNYQKALNFFLPLYKKYDIEDSLNSKERRILDGTYTQQDVIDMDWAYETYWALCWCLGLVDDIRVASSICDCDKAISFVSNSNSLDDFKSKCKLRNITEILNMHDLYFRYNWAINNKKIDANTSIGNLNPSNVLERRRGLEWIISPENDWYNILLDT